MKGRQYQYQGFLLQCPYRNVELENYCRELPADTPLYLQEINLFDFPVYRRKIPLSVLDGNVDTKEDFDAVVQKIKCVDELYLVDDRKKFESIFVQKHATATKKAFLWHFLNERVQCFIAL